MSAVEGAIRRCDHPGCTATYDAAAVMAGQASAAGWVTHLSRGEHYCPAHQDSPVLAAQRRLAGRHGSDWHRALADLPGRWPREDLMDLLTATPTTSGVWRRMAAEVLDVLDAEPASPDADALTELLADLDRDPDGYMSRSTMAALVRSCWPGAHAGPPEYEPCECGYQEAEGCPCDAPSVGTLPEATP